MARWHGDLKKRRASGGRKHAYRKKRAYEIGREPSETELGEERRFIKRARGGRRKVVLLRTRYANVTDPSSRKTERVKISEVVRNPVSADYDRRGIITKGAVILTPLGEAVVTSRPGQHGVVNAVLIHRSNHR